MREFIRSTNDNANYNVLTRKPNREWAGDMPRAAKAIKKTVAKTPTAVKAKAPRIAPQGKDIKECEKILKSYVGNGFSPKFKNSVNLTGISVDNANEIIRAIDSMHAQFDLPKLNGFKSISAKSKTGQKIFTDADAVAAYNPAEHGIYLNRDVLKDRNAIEAYAKKAKDAWDYVIKNIDKLSGKQREVAEKYKAAGRSLVGDGSVHDYLVHEMGHHVEWTMMPVKLRNEMSKSMAVYAPKLSGYANSSVSEYIAESFAAFVKGEEDILDPAFSSMLKEKDSGLQPYHEGGNTILSVNGGLSTIPGIELSGNELETLRGALNADSEIGRGIKRGVVKKRTSNYLYLVDVIDYDDYKVFAKIDVEDVNIHEIRKVKDEYK